MPEDQTCALTGLKHVLTHSTSFSIVWECLIKAKFANCSFGVFLLACHDKTLCSNSSCPASFISVTEELAVQLKMKCSLLTSFVTLWGQSDDTAVICMSFTVADILPEHPTLMKLD